MTNKSWQKLKYLENEKSFSVDIKSIFHHIKRGFSEANKITFLGRLESKFILDRFFLNGWGRFSLRFIVL